MDGIERHLGVADAAIERLLIGVEFIRLALAFATGLFGERVRERLAARVGDGFVPFLMGRQIGFQSLASLLHGAAASFCSRFGRVVLLLSAVHSRIRWINPCARYVE